MPEDPAELFTKALRRYLRARCPEILGYARITGQRSVKISLRGLYSAYSPGERYPRLSDALRAALEDRPGFLEGLSLDLVEEGGESYLTVSVERLSKLCEEVLGIS